MSASGPKLKDLRLCNLSAFDPLLTSPESERRRYPAAVESVGVGQAARQQDNAKQAQEPSPGVETLRKSHEQQREPSPIPLG